MSENASGSDSGEQPAKRARREVGEASNLGAARKDPNTPMINERVWYFLKNDGVFSHDVRTQSARNSIRKSAAKFVWQEDVLYRVLPDTSLRRVACPKDLDYVREVCHNQGHVGQRATLQRAQAVFWWPNMVHTCAEMVRTCDSCQKQHDKSKRFDRELHTVSVLGLLPFQRVAIDLAGPFRKTASGNKYLMVFVCYLTKWVEAFAIPDSKAKTVARVFFNEGICRYGCPLEVVSDNGPSFDKEFSDLLYDWGVHRIRIAPYHPQANGLVERCIKTVKGALSRMVGQHAAAWDTQLGFILLAYRNGQQASTGYSPYQLMFGRHAIMPETLVRINGKFNFGDDANAEQQYIGQLLVTAKQMEYTLWHVQENIAASQAKQREDYAIRKRTQAAMIKSVRELSVGSLVLVKRPDSSVRGLEYSWQGPYQFKGFLSELKKTAIIYDPEHDKLFRRAVTQVKPYYQPSHSTV